MYQFLSIPVFSLSWLWGNKNKQCLHSGALLRTPYINGAPCREQCFPALVITDLSVFSGNYLKQSKNVEKRFWHTYDPGRIKEADVTVRGMGRKQSVPHCQH